MWIFVMQTLNTLSLKEFYTILVTIYEMKARFQIIIVRKFHNRGTSMKKWVCFYITLYFSELYRELPYALVNKVAY